MSWRTVVISSRCKLDLKMGSMVIRGEDTKRIFLDEIALLLIENPAVSLTGCLLEALVEKKIRVVFCDRKRSPMAELHPFYGSHDCSEKLKTQIAWSDEVKGAVWAAIVCEKIEKQAAFAEEFGKAEEATLMRSYIPQVEWHDTTNREGHAAKVYFNAVFGKEFTRSRDCVTNAALNYGYGLLLSAFNRELVSAGYATQLGIFHANRFNPYNLSCDLMEPFRVLIDRCVHAEEFTTLEGAQKHRLWNVLNDTVTIRGTQQTVLNAVRMYTHSVLDALNSADLSHLQFYSL